MQRIELLFESYNMAVEGGYNRVFMNKKPEQIFRLREESIEPYVKQEIMVWENTPMEGLGGLTPAGYLNTIENFYEIIEHFKLGAKLSDSGIPRILKDRLKAFGEEAVDTMLGLATDDRLIHNEEELPIAVEALHVLGEWKTAKAVHSLLKVMESCKESEELILEEITETLMNIEDPAIEPIITILNEMWNIDYIGEYLYLALARIGNKHKADAVYICLKNVFLKMENKVYGAIGLVNYGDSRAVTLLRGYAKKNKGILDNETFYEIKRAVQKLGGSLEEEEMR